MNARRENQLRQTTLLTALKEVMYKTDLLKFIKFINGNGLWVDHLENIRTHFGKAETFLRVFASNHSRDGFVLDVFIIVIIQQNLCLICREIR